MVESAIVTDDKYAWDKTLELRDGPLAMSLLADRRAQLMGQGFAILEGFVDSIRAPSRVHEVLKMPASFDTTTLVDL